MRFYYYRIQKGGNGWIYKHEMGSRSHSPYYGSLKRIKAKSKKEAYKEIIKMRGTYRAIKFVSRRKAKKLTNMKLKKHTN